MPKLDPTTATALERYRSILRSELARVDLSPAEWSLLAEAWSVHDGEIDRWDVAGIDVTAQLAIRGHGLAERWGIDGEALLAKLRALTFAGRCAVVDHIERGVAS